MQQHNKLHYVNKVYQTEAYQLNIIEKDDNFSTDPLNENMEKVEAKLAALDGADAALEARADGLEGRVTALEVHKIVAGTYQGGGGTEKNIQVGFTPIAVIVCLQQPTDPESCVVAVANSFAGSTKIPFLSITEGGFIVHTSNYNISINRGGTCHYIAFG